MSARYTKTISENKEIWEKFTKIYVGKAKKTRNCEVV